MLKAMMMMVMMTFFVAFFSVAQLGIGNHLCVLRSPQCFCQIKHLTVVFRKQPFHHIAIVIGNIAQLITAGERISRLITI